MGKLWKLQLTNCDNSSRTDHKEESYTITNYIEKRHIKHIYKKLDKRTQINENTFEYIIPDTVIISYSCDIYSMYEKCISNWTIEFKADKKEKKLKPVKIIEIEYDSEEYNDISNSTKHTKIKYKKDCYNHYYEVVYYDEAVEYINEDNPKEVKELAEEYIKENIYFDIEPIEELSAIQQK